MSFAQISCCFCLGHCRPDDDLSRAGCGLRTEGCAPLQLRSYSNDHKPHQRGKDKPTDWATCNIKTSKVKHHLRMQQMAYILQSHECSKFRQQRPAQTTNDGRTLFLFLLRRERRHAETTLLFLLLRSGVRRSR